MKLEVEPQNTLIDKDFIKSLKINGSSEDSLDEFSEEETGKDSDDCPTNSKSIAQQMAENFFKKKSHQRRTYDFRKKPRVKNYSDNF